MLWLIGMMGTGKSTVAQAVEERTGCIRRDMDEELEQRYGPIVVQWEAVGEQGFRQRESQLLEELTTGSPNTIIATGGGVPLRAENVTSMRSTGTIIWLRTGVNTLSERVEASSNRPLLTLRTVEEIAEARATFYEAAADVIIDTDGKTTREICQEVITAWQR